MLQQTIDAVIYAIVTIGLHCILLCCVSKQDCHNVLLGQRLESRVWRTRMHIVKPLKISEHLST